MKDEPGMMVIDSLQILALDDALRGFVRGSWSRTRPLVASSEAQRYERFRLILNASRVPPRNRAYFSPMPLTPYADASYAYASYASASYASASYASYAYAPYAPNEYL